MNLISLRSDIVLQFTYGFLVFLILVSFMLISITIMDRDTKRNVLLYLFNSATSKIQLHLYFGMVSIFSIFEYTAFSTIVNGIPLDIAALGKSIGIVFFGIGVSSVGSGLQAKTDIFQSDGDDPDEDDPTEKLTTYTVQSNFFLRLFDSSDRSFELHLVLGAIAILMIIFYEGYDIAYITKNYYPEDYGYALAYAFVGMGAAGWGQSVQRRFESEKKQKPKRKVPTRKKL